MFLKGSISLLVATAFCSIGSGQVLFDTSFESIEGYSYGLINSQQGWTTFDGDNTGTVVNFRPKSGANSLEIDSLNVESSAYWYPSINVDMSLQTNKVVRVSWSQYVQSPAGSPSPSNCSIYGVHSFSDDDELIGGLDFDNYDRSVYYYQPLISDWMPVANLAPPRDTYVDFAYTIDYVDRKIRYEVGGVTLPIVSSILTNSNVFGNADIFIEYAATDMAWFDDYRIQLFPEGTLSGRVTLQDYLGDPTTKTVDVELRTPGSTVPLDPAASSPIDAEGRFYVTTARRGTYDVAIRCNGFLRKVIPNVPISNNGVFTLHSSLINGDIDQDNVISIFDYSALSIHFDLDSSYPGWTTIDPNTGTRPSDSDLDGDEFVSIFDYSILSLNFDTVGDD